MEFESAIAYVETALGAYALVGAALLVPMHLAVLPKIDGSADGASWGFRLVVSPGLIALWPIVIEKWLTARRGGDPHGNPEQPVSSRQIRGVQSLLIKLLAIALPLLFAAALYTRPAPPAPAKLPQEPAANVR